MSIFAKQEICVHFKEIHCLSSYPCGPSALRIFMFYKAKNKHYYAIPVSHLQKTPTKSNDHIQIGENFYRTKEFLMRPDRTAELEEICIFKNEVNILTYEPDYNDLMLEVVCELLKVDGGKDTVVDVFYGKISRASVSQFLLIDFFQAFPCQITGSIHSCIYQYEFFQGNTDFPNLESYCIFHPEEYVQQLLRYLLIEGKNNLEMIQKFSHMYDPPKKLEIKYSFHLRKEGQHRQAKDLFKSIKAKSIHFAAQKMHKEERQFDSRPTEAQINQIQDGKNPNFKRKRKKIFSNEYHQKRKTMKNIGMVEDFQKAYHENATKIYSKWRQMIQSLISEQFSQKTFKQLQFAYYLKTKKLLGQSVVRFKGSRDTDIYSNELDQRNKIAFQARNIFSVNLAAQNALDFLDDRICSQNKPILFEESVPSLDDLKQNKKQEIFVILVHGLGACRLDMDRFRTQLKRYFKQRVKIFTSFANEGRTEGDIHSMGLRLATQVDHELSKLQKIPPITFIGHSMGGLIIRCALPKLSKYYEHFNSFVTLSTPHVGYCYSNSTIIDAGLWVINNWKKSQSLLQMTMSDRPKKQDCFLYKLSKLGGLEHFKKVVFLSSHQDCYVPYYSARIQKHQESLKDQKKHIEKAMLYNQMIDSILNNIRGEIIRIDVNFSILQHDLNNLIGRAAHICFVQNCDLFRTLCQTNQSLFF